MKNLKINEIYCMDVNDFLDEIPNQSVDLIIADPPYNVKIAEWDNFEYNDYWIFMKKWISKAIKKMKVGASIYIFNNQLNSAITLNFLIRDLNFNNWITWYKKDGFHPTKNKYVSNQETILFFSKGRPSIFNFNEIRIPYLSAERFKNSKNGIKAKNGTRWYPNPNGKLCTDVWEISSDRHKKKIKGKIVKNNHPTVKPEEIIERIIKASSNNNSLILDLFSGSGTTSYVAKKYNRNFIGCELNKIFFKIAKERIQSIKKE